MKKERDYWMIYFDVTDIDESATIWIIDPVPFSQIYTWGIWTGIDYRGNPISGPIVLSKNEMNSSEVENILFKKILISQKWKAITSSQ